jgi:hypothetical protein
MKFVQKITLPLYLIGYRIQNTFNNLWSEEEYVGDYVDAGHLKDAVWKKLSDVTYNSSDLMRNPTNARKLQQVVHATENLKNTLLSVYYNGGTYGSDMVSGTVLKAAVNLADRSKQAAAQIAGDRNLVATFAEKTMGEARTLRFVLRGGRRYASEEQHKAVMKLMYESDRNMYVPWPQNYVLDGFQR